MKRPRALASRLRHRVDVQRKNQIPNGRGGRTTPPGETPWTTIAPSVAAEVVALRGDEAVRHSVERAVQLWRVTMRMRSDLTPADRLVWGGIVMDIKAAAPNIDQTELVMTCESGANGA